MEIFGVGSQEQVAFFLISCHSTTAEEDGAEWMAAPDALWHLFAVLLSNVQQ